MYVLCVITVSPSFVEMLPPHNIYDGIGSLVWTVVVILFLFFLSEVIERLNYVTLHVDIIRTVLQIELRLVSFVKLFRPNTHSNILLVGPNKFL